MGIYSSKPRPLFPSTLLPLSSKSPFSTSPSLSLRPLYRADYALGHAALLPFADKYPLTESQWTQRFDLLSSCPGTYYIVVIEDADATESRKKIVGTGTLFVERKFLFNLGIQGHIEDVSISTEYQRKGLGQALIKALGHIAKEVGCYKTILDCRETKEGFYLKCSFERRGLEMHQYHDAEAEKCSV